jgi:hypothetical protein
MNRSIYFNYIEEKLNFLAFRIGQRSKINLLELNLHSETFFADFLNIIYGFSLINLNEIRQNCEGIDLIDEKNKLIVQVSSTCTKQKVESSLQKKVFAELNGYHFKFMSIANDAGDLRTKTFANPYGATFLPKEDIIDIPMVLKHVQNMTIDELKTIYEFIKKELGDNREGSVFSNLAAIIDILAREDLSYGAESPEINVHNINEKITFNDLADVKDLIDEYKVYYSTLNEIYSEFDKLGSNKSNSVLKKIMRLYIELLNEHHEPRSLFLAVISATAESIILSKNYKEIPIEELEMCTHILVVDAFIRCKIFRNPGGYSHVITR